MKREFLEELGLEKENIDKIMAEHGKTVQGLNTKISENETELTSLKTQIAERDKDIEDLKAKATDPELKGKYEALEAKYQEDTESLTNQINATRKNSAIEIELMKRGALNNKTVIPLLDQDTIKLTDDGVQGLSEQLDKIAEDNPFLFATDESDDGKPNFSVNQNPSKHKMTATQKLEEALGIVRKE